VNSAALVDQRSISCLVGISHDDHELSVLVLEAVKCNNARNRSQLGTNRLRRRVPLGFSTGRPSHFDTTMYKGATLPCWSALQAR
jgi:hypothetical protein